MRRFGSTRRGGDRASCGACGSTHVLRSCVILRLLKHLLHIGDAKLPGVILPQGVQVVGPRFSSRMMVFGLASKARMSSTSGATAGGCSIGLRSMAWIYAGRSAIVNPEPAQTNPRRRGDAWRGRQVEG